VEEYHFRTVDKKEVDFVIESIDYGTIGIEVKLSSNIIAQDFNNLKLLSCAVGGRFKKGIIIYTGKTILSFGENMWAVPVCYLWEK
jgi:predicted AAA+ superfamily ATPase